MAKVVGSLAKAKPSQDHTISGILVKRNFNYHIMAPSDLPNYTDLALSTVTQRQSVTYTGTLAQLQYYLNQLSGDVQKVSDKDIKKGIKVFKAVTVTLEQKMAIIEWVANPINDMYADAVLTVILKAEADAMPNKVFPAPIHVDKSHFKECLHEMLGEMFGAKSVSPFIKGDKLSVSVDGKTASIDLATNDVKCDEDEEFQQMVHTAVTKLHQAISPAKI